MQPVSPEEKPSPLQDANFCSRLFSWWLNPLFKIGYQRKLKQDDLYSVLPEDRSQHLGEELQWYWDQEVLRAKKGAQEPSLIKAIVKCYWKFYFLLGLLTFLEEGTKVVLPIFLGKIISYVENYDPANSAALHEAYGCAAGLSACVLVWAVLHHLCFYHMQRVGMRLRVAVCHMIYRKSLRLSSSAMGKTTTGQIVNLLSNDVNRFDQSVAAVGQICIEQFSFLDDPALKSGDFPCGSDGNNILALSVGGATAGYRSDCPALDRNRNIVSCWDSGSHYSSAFAKLRRKFIFITQPHSPSSICDRTVAGDEAPNGDEIDLKQAPEGWREEISRILKSSYLRGMNLASFFAVSKIMIFVTFITNELLDNRITASQVFVVVTLFEALRFSSTLYFPMAVEKVSETIVSIQRIKNFLSLDEMPQLNTQLPSDAEMMVDMQDFTAFWDEEGTKVVLPIFLGKIISYVENYDPANSAALHEAYGCAAGLSACVLVWAVLHHLCFYHMQRVGMRLRVAVCHMIYRKSLRLSSSAMGKTTTGQIVNLLSNDVNRFDQSVAAVGQICIEQFSFLDDPALKSGDFPCGSDGNNILALSVGGATAGYRSDCPALDRNRNIVSCWDSGSHYSSAFAKLRRKFIFITQPHSPSSICDRTVAGDEAPNGDEIDLKQAPEGWREEISRILKSSYLRGMNLASFFAVSKIMIFVTFITNELLDNRITASQVFVVVTLFEALRFSSTLYFPMAVEKVSETIVSIQRIKNFLSLDEMPQLNTQLPSDAEMMVDMQDFTAFWDEESESPTLKGLSFTVRPGELLTVIGPVGAGKSSLLRALLGELPPSQGKVSVHGRIAYVSQQPWVFPGTVRSNILFGKKYEEERYEEVIKACALEETENIQVTLPLEDYLEGKVGFKTYENYFTASAGWPVISFLILVNITAQVAYVLQDWWLAFWANVQGDLYSGALVKEDVDTMLILNWYLRVYSGLTMSTILFGITKSLLIFYILVNSSQTLHNKILESILRAPVLFFNSNPIGRILNRFSKDIGHMDDLLPLIIQDFIQRYYSATSRDVKRLECASEYGTLSEEPDSSEFSVLFGARLWHPPDRVMGSEFTCIIAVSTLLPDGVSSAARSPVFSHLAFSLRGLWTIRAYKAEQSFQELFDAHQDLHSEAWFLLLTTSRWLAVYLDVICAVFITIVAFVSLILADTALNVESELYTKVLETLMMKVRIMTRFLTFGMLSTLTPGQVGLVLSLALTLTGMFQRYTYFVLAFIPMISVERVMEYLDLEKEAPWEYKDRPPPRWANEGRIRFDTVYFRHTLDGPLVLKNLTAIIESRKKEPVLFTGTMRKNLDPFNEHTDKELWNALEEVQLKETIEGLAGKMDTALAETGSNLSVGQRQLVCLARVILKKNQILIIDKATSNVDPRTDELIKEAIHEKFAQCTVVTITHRLSTIIDSDKIMVLDSGTVKEYSPAHDLLQNSESLFYKMVQQLGEAEATALTERAKQVHTKKK
ncbi:hypothetical protein MJG53_010001 [Ovis ammon polii x Ovis aries]|uniref:Uncharacterized protein n=1 Tax=Ovis ammon polii x Ovis aries TaxID=2918886 RepID=A0ACB9UVS6_9CETA|nr:hypothetical protein MJG53_010001 [Ovis ammon polii x Ovis aries]